MVRNCAACRWYHNERKGSEHDPRGSCRRYPPLFVMSEPEDYGKPGTLPYEPHDDPYNWSQPVVYPQDACGEWTEREATDG